MNAYDILDSDRILRARALAKANEDFQRSAAPYFEELVFIETGFHYVVSMTISKDGVVTTNYAEYPPEVAKYKAALEGMIEFIRDQCYRKAHIEIQLPSSHD